MQGFQRLQPGFGIGLEKLAGKAGHQELVSLFDQQRNFLSRQRGARSLEFLAYRNFETAVFAQGTVPHSVGIAKGDEGGGKTGEAATRCGIQQLVRIHARKGTDLDFRRAGQGRAIEGAEGLERMFFVRQRGDDDRAGGSHAGRKNGDSEVKGKGHRNQGARVAVAR